MKQLEYKTSFQKKAAINSILSSELGGCKHRINARYEWKRPDQVLTVGVSHKNTFEVGINLNIGRQELFGDSNSELMLEITYRAYYISAYIRCLDDATTAIPQSYFSGLVLICAINSVCGGKKVKAFSPIKRIIHDLRPIDVHCAIHALTRLTIDYAERIPEKTRGVISRIINELLTYSALPEIGYKGDEPIYSLLQETRCLQENVILHRCFMTDYMFFDKLSTKVFIDLSIEELVCFCENSQNPFWGNFIMRLSAHLGRHIETARNQKPFISSCILRFEEDSVRYYRETKQTDNMILTDNLEAIKWLSKMSEQTFSVVTANCGKIHFFQ
jgi:hypothetical protein